MVKFCPECGYELEGNEKICPECGRNLSFIIKQSEKDEKNLNKSNSFLKFMPVVIIAVVLIGAFLLFSGSSDSGESISITVSESGEWVSSFDNNTTYYYNYYVYGYITGWPSDTQNYFIKTIYYNENDSEVGRTTESLESIHRYLSESDIHTLSSLFKENEISVDHVKIQVIKDNEVIKEFEDDFDTNNVDYFL